MLLIICSSAFGYWRYLVVFSEQQQQQFDNESTDIKKLEIDIEQSLTLVNSQSKLLSDIFNISPTVEGGSDNSVLPRDMDLLMPSGIVEVEFSDSRLEKLSSFIQFSLQNIANSKYISTSYLAWQHESQSFRFLSNDINNKAPADMLSWLALHAHKSKNNLNQSFITPPIKMKQMGTNKNYIIYSFIIQGKQYFVIAELDIALLPEARTAESQNLLWHTESGFLVQSNIEEQNNRYVLSNNPLLAVTALPQPIQQRIISRSVDLGTVELVSIGDGAQKLLRKYEVAHQQYGILFTKPAAGLKAQVLEQVGQEIIIILAMGLLLILVFYAIIVQLIARPTSRLIEYIEAQSSVFDTDTPDIPPGWFNWFEKIQSSFLDNRNLLSNLTNKNKELDLKVKDRTRELMQQTISKDRNLALNRAMMNTIPSSLYYKNVSGGYLGCNKAYEELIGVKENDLVAKTAMDLFTGEKAEQIELVEQKIIESNQVHIEQEWLTNKDGQDVLLRWLYSPITNTKGEVLGILGLGQDITEQDSTFKKLSTAVKDAERANQVKGDFIANISHEIRTPMNSIIGMLQLLDDTLDDPNQKGYTKVAETSAKSLLKVINNILDFSKGSAEKLQVESEVFSICSVLESSFANSTAKAMSKGVILDTQFPTEFPELFVGDEVKIGQIFTNLIGNAVKFTEQGSVIVTGKMLKQVGSKQTVQFEVRDTGIGIAEDQQQKVFEAFSQADNSVTRKYGGTGLGLTITYQLVQLLDGNIELASTVNEGTVFTLTFEFEQVAEQPKVPKLDKQWLYWDHKENVRSILHDKLAAYGITAKELDVTTAQPFEPSEAVLICRPEALEHMPEHILDDIKSQSLELQPVSYTLSPHSNLLANLPHYPMLTAPFNVQTMMLNVLQLRQILPDSKNHKVSSLAGLSVLVVEDNAVNQQVLSLMLENEQAGVYIVGNGLDALERLEKDKFDIVITDIQMPVMDGLTLAETIRVSGASYQEIPIIAVSAHTSEEDLTMSLESGINVHLTKPLIKEQLLESIKTQIGRAHV